MARSKRTSYGIFTEKMKTIEQDLTGEYGIDDTAQYVMDCLEDKVSPELLELLNGVLLGFAPDMQLEMADDLLDFVCGHVIHTTGCFSADEVLFQCYTWIGMEQGIVNEKIADIWNMMFNLNCGRA